MIWQLYWCSWCCWELHAATLACRENRSLAHLYRRLQEMEREQKMKKLELAAARQEIEQRKLQLSLEA